MQKGRTKVRPLHESFVSNVVRRCLGSWFAGGEGEGGFHGGEQLLGDLFSAAEAGCGIFYVDDPIANPLTHGVVEMVEPAAEGAVFVEDALEFPGDGDDAFCGVGFEVEESGIARSSV